MVFYTMAGVAGLTTILMLIFGIEPRNIKVKDEQEVEPEKASRCQAAHPQAGHWWRCGEPWF